MEREVAWKKYDEASLDELEALAVDYIDFISENKTERECAAAPSPLLRTPATIRWLIASPPARRLGPGSKAGGLRPGRKAAAFSSHVGAAPICLRADEHPGGRTSNVGRASTSTQNPL